MATTTPRKTVRKTAPTSARPRAEVRTPKLPSRDDLKGVAALVDTDRILGVIRDAAYVVIGFGVLTVQQIQARVKDVVDSAEKSPVAKQMGINRAQLEEYLARFESEIAKFDERVDEIEAKLDTAVERFEERLPKQAAEALGQAHDLAKAARKQVRGLLRPVA